MKKFLPLFLILGILLSTPACTAFERVPNNSVVFYYLAENITYGNDDSLIRSETVAVTQRDDLLGILRMYLSGPTSASLTSPFPERLTVIDFSMYNMQAHITLSRAIKQLSGINLSVACACLAKTIFSNTDAQFVILYAEDGFSEFDGALTFTRETVITYDDSGSVSSDS